MEDPTTAHYKISSRGRQVLIFLSVGSVCGRIHDAMYVNVQDLQQKIGPQH